MQLVEVHDCLAVGQCNVTLLGTLGTQTPEQVSKMVLRKPGGSEIMIQKSLDVHPILVRKILLKPPPPKKRPQNKEKSVNGEIVL